MCESQKKSKMPSVYLNKSRKFGDFCGGPCHPSHPQSSINERYNQRRGHVRAPWHVHRIH